METTNTQHARFRNTTMELITTDGGRALGLDAQGRLVAQFHGLREDGNGTLTLTPGSTVNLYRPESGDIQERFTYDTHQGQFEMLEPVEEDGTVCLRGCFIPVKGLVVAGKRMGYWEGETEDGSNWCEVQYQDGRMAVLAFSVDGRVESYSGSIPDVSEPKRPSYQPRREGEHGGIYIHG